MPNLVCFPHYTCGGLLVDILSDTFSPIHPFNNGISSVAHSIGKIGDSDTVLTDFDATQFIDKLNRLKLSDDEWIGTHCWPGNIDLSTFNQVICVTTMTYRSRIYRWARAFYHYYLNSSPWQLSDMHLVDKQRETAKNYVVPFSPVPGAINIEFSEIVENNIQFQHLVNGHNADASLDRWKEINKFLYDNNFWQSVPVQRYYEAELELTLGQSYVYK
jgi:hypothetical protein